METIAPCNENKEKKILKILAINVNSIISLYRRNNLNIFLKKQSPDILAISETKLNKNHKLFFENYCIFRNDREKKEGGGTALLIKKNICCKKISTPSNLEVIETTMISIKLSQNKIFFIISAYASSSNKSQINNDLNIISKKLKLEHPDNSYIIIGDLNSRHSLWNNPKANYRGRQLKNWIEQNEITLNAKLLHSQIPTFYNSDSFIDIAIVKSSIKIKEKYLFTLDYESDHRAIGIHVQLSDKLPVVNSLNNKVKFNFKKTNTKKFQINLDSIYTEIILDNVNLSNSDIDFHIEKLESAITKAIEKSTTKFKEINSPIVA